MTNEEVENQEPQVVRKLPTRYERLELDEEFEGWWFEGLVSVPMGRLAELLEHASVLDSPEAVQAAKPAQIGAALLALVNHMRFSTREWNFVDENGQSLPLDDEESWKQLPMDLVTGMVAKLMRAIQKPPLAKGGSLPPPSSEATATTPGS
ncbi:hypothetical protein LCGC14_0623140 [marine sediment metagenome]|uniref:Uncharacterized protein n=1 Tax=marine sediment metagenome TaxID=412755 RepID=A0A0F9RNM2_9ZZZZ